MRKCQHRRSTKGPVLGTLLFLIYIKDLPGHLTSKGKLFADDKSLFTVVYDISTSANELNNHSKIRLLIEHFNRK